MNITKRNVLITMLVLSLAVFSFASAFNVNGKEVTFKDFQDSHWAYQNVKVLVEAGAIGGYPDGSFKPSGTITNAEFIKIATVQAGFDGKAEVGAAWYKPYVDFAYDKGIIEKGIFSDNAWNKPITRDKMCYVIAKVGEYLGEDFSYTSEIKSGMDLAVTDVKSMSEPYKTCVYKALSKGIVTGYANNKSFEPSWNATRAEAAAMLSRLSDKNLRATTHFVSSVVKVDKDFISKMDKVWDTKKSSPQVKDGLKPIYDVGLKGLLSDFEKQGVPIYYDKENECKCAVGYCEIDHKNAFSVVADRSFFTPTRGTFKKLTEGETDHSIDEYIFYKDGSMDSTHGDFNEHWGQNIDNVATVVLDIVYADKNEEVWVIEKPIIDKAKEMYKSYGGAWWRTLAEITFIH